MGLRQLRTTTTAPGEQVPLPRSGMDHWWITFDGATGPTLDGAVLACDNSGRVQCVHHHQQHQPCGQHKHTIIQEGD